MAGRVVVVEWEHDPDGDHSYLDQECFSDMSEDDIECLMFAAFDEMGEVADSLGCIDEMADGPIYIGSVYSAAHADELVEQGQMSVYQRSLTTEAFGANQ